MNGFIIGTWEQCIPCIISVSILSSSIIDDNRQHEIYDHIKTNLIVIDKINHIVPYFGKYSSTPTILMGTVNQLCVSIGQVIELKTYDFNQYGNYIPVYSTKSGAINTIPILSMYFQPDFTGTIYNYFPNGKIQYKICYFKSKLKTLYCYYNSIFNTIWYSFHINSNTNQITEYQYNDKEEYMGKILINNITKEIIKLIKNRKDLPIGCVSLDVQFNSMYVKYHSHLKLS